jgi:hypothetical protein
MTRKESHDRPPRLAAGRVEGFDSDTAEEHTTQCIPDQSVDGCGHPEAATRKTRDHSQVRTRSRAAVSGAKPRITS